MKQWVYKDVFGAVMFIFLKLQMDLTINLKLKTATATQKTQEYNNQRAESLMKS